MYNHARRRVTTPHPSPHVGGDFYERFAYPEIIKRKPGKTDYERAKIMIQRPTENVNEIQAQYGVKTLSPIILEAVAEGSNREHDWLWYAEQLSSAGERRYCWERALYINPASRVALINLARQHHTSRRPTFGFNPVRFFESRKPAPTSPLA